MKIRVRDHVKVGGDKMAKVGLLIKLKARFRWLATSTRRSRFVSLPGAQVLLSLICRAASTCSNGRRAHEKGNCFVRMFFALG